MAILLVPARFLKMVLLKTLKASPRSCRATLSPKWMFLNIEKSTRLVGGPLIIPRPAFPTTLATPVPLVGFAWKQEISNHRSNVWGAFAFGLQVTLGRLPATSAGILPSPAASKLVVGVKPRPVC